MSNSSHSTVSLGHGPDAVPTADDEQQSAPIVPCPKSGKDRQADVLKSWADVNGPIHAPHRQLISCTAHVLRLLGERAGTAARNTIMAMTITTLFLVGAACTGGGPVVQDRPVAPPPAVPHPPARVIDVLPGAHDANVASSRLLAKVVLSALLPGDEFILINGDDFSLISSDVVPGERLDPGEVAKCAQSSVGGPSPRCQNVARVQLDLAHWRTMKASQIEALPNPADGTPVRDECHRNGWPYENFMKILVGIAEDRADITTMIIVSGDAEARGDQPRLPAAYLQNVQIFAAPACGDPVNLRDWFSNAAAVRVFMSERPTSMFAAFLFSEPATIHTAVSK